METENCLWCLRDCPINEFCTCEDGKRRMERTARGNLPRVGIRQPATPDAPEWKGGGGALEIVVHPAPAMRPCDCAHDFTQQTMVMASGRTRRVCIYCGLIGDLSPAPEVKLHIDRALDDFIARRKAKREQSDIEAFFEGSQWTEHLDSYPPHSPTIRL